MTSTNTPEVRRRSPGLRPGIQSPEHLAAWMAGSERTRFGSPDRPRCTAICRRSGQACRGFAMTGLSLCWIHAGRLRPPRRRPSANPQVALRRTLAATLRKIWQRSPWAVGATVRLPDREEEQFLVELRRNGLGPDRTAPSVLDWLRWRWRRAWMDGTERPSVWTAALAEAPARIQKAGAPPAGWAWNPTVDANARERAPYWAETASPRSKRRRPDPVKRTCRPTVQHLPVATKLEPWPRLRLAEDEAAE